MKSNLCMNVMALLLALVMVASPVMAATSEPADPMATALLFDYSASASRPTSGAVEVRFSATGMTLLDKIGAKSIKVYQSYDNHNWTLVKTYSASSTSGMLISDDFSHDGGVTYSGYVGVYYKAYVQLYGEDNGISESKYKWTSVVV